MIHLKIKDINNFMQHLLVQDTFHHFLVYEGEICTSNLFQFDGHINKKFYNHDEPEALTEDFISWETIKPICFQMIKGEKVPTKIKLVFAFPKGSYEKLIADCGIHISPEEIGGLYLHITYENGLVKIITGTTLNTFTMDKTLDHYWDHLMQKFFQHYFDVEDFV